MAKPSAYKGIDEDCFVLRQAGLFSWSIIIFLILYTLPGNGQIASERAPAKDIYGIWKNSQFDYQMILQLNKDGSGEFDGETIRYTIQGNQLTVRIGELETQYTYSVKGNALTLAGGDLDGEVMFVRSGGMSNDSDTDRSQEAPTFSNTADKLIGLWSGNGEMIEFRANGKCVYLTNTFPYQISKGHIIMTTAQGPVSFEYTVKGKKLSLLVNGKYVIYIKAEGTDPVKKPVARKGEVARELVGEWCYLNMNTNSQSSRCITLRADGTYYYTENSSRSVNTNELSGGTSSQGEDRGTWYLQGDRIYYNSQTNGEGSYRLEKKNHPKNVNDPMIVLDGEAYVTATRRAPWR